MGKREEDDERVYWSEQLLCIQCMGAMSVSMGKQRQCNEAASNSFDFAGISNHEISILQPPDVSIQPRNFNASAACSLRMRFSISLRPMESGSHMGNNPRPKLFHSCGRSLFIIAHYFCGKAKQLPFPFGRLAASVQDTVGSWMLLPVVVAEGYCLHILAVADNQLCVIEGLARHTFPPVSVLFDKAQKLEDVLVQMPEILVTTVDKLAERGLVGSIADLWIKHEADLKDQMDRVLNITQKVPILSSVGILVNAVVSPVAGTVSSWMLKHSEVEVKEVSFDSSGVKDVTDDTQDGPKHGSGNECLLPEKSEPLVGSNDNTAVKHDGNSGKMLQEDDDSAVKDMEHSGRTVQEDDDKIIEQKHEVKSIPVPLKMMEMPVDPLLELFDSTWHMTPSVISPKPGLSPKLRSDK